MYKKIKLNFLLTLLDYFFMQQKKQLTQTKNIYKKFKLNKRKQTKPKII